jgi:hypothetical protein
LIRGRSAVAVVEEKAMHASNERPRLAKEALFSFAFEPEEAQRVMAELLRLFALE